ncbi:hypothetical protein EGW08_022334 [Elysia chlorotica]|uniref:Uncharacterized protein n=1 Tax=Elysia chlorotica TaxID=188477 RepID=A0A433SL87_ELYCH|nr:hypothetical protein EGW08_022334 [Elysia chlorotica]
MIFLPMVGRWADGGKNPKARKLYSLYAGLGVFGTGLILMIVVSFLKMRQLDSILDTLDTPAHGVTSTLPLAPLDLTRSLVQGVTDNSTHSTAPLPYPAVSGNPPGHAPMHGSPASHDETFTERIMGYASLPAMVFISIVGFAAIDMGFDLTVSLSRALILENVPKFQHMNVLVLATVVQAFAGTTCSAIGCFDLSTFLGSAFNTDGTAALLVFFCCILLGASIIGFVLMTLASYKLNKSRLARAASFSSVKTLIPHSNSTSMFPNASSSFNANISQSEDSEMDKLKTHVSRPRDVKRKLTIGQLEHLQEESSYVPDILHTEEGDTCTKPLLLEDSLRAHYSAINAAANSTAEYNNTQGDSVNESSDAERPAEISLSAPNRATGQNSAFDNVGVSTVLNTIRQSYSMSMSQRGGLGEFHNRKLTQLREAQSKISAREREAARSKLRKRLTVLCISSFFTIGASISSSVYSSNTLNLGILHGDPTGLPGTEGRANYERGLQMGAIGNFIMYTSFMAVSLSNNRIIESIGERGQFALFHALMIVALVTVVSTRLVEVYFVFMVFCGAFRTCFLTLPFVLAHKFTQEGMSTEPVDPEQKLSHTGRVMTLIGFLIPTHYMILSILMGPLMEATGNPWVPLFYCLGSSSVSLGIFSLLFFL